VSSPNEPGYPRPGDGPAAPNGSISGGSGTDSGFLGNAAARPGTTAGTSSGASTHFAEPDTPPWQRGRTARSALPSQTRAESTPTSGSAGHAAGVDARINRFISGTSSVSSGGNVPVAEPPAARTEMVRSEAYGSELPDLSGPRPTRRPVTDSGADSSSRPSLSARVQVSNRPRGPVRASMQIRRIDPWSALKVSLILSVALFFVWMIAVAFLYLVLGGMGVWSKLNSNVGDLLTSGGGAGGELVSSGSIFGGALLIGLVNIVLLTAMATVGALIYNLTTDIVGGIEVTLADRD
jgi:hypothetical protein